MAKKKLSPKQKAALEKGRKALAAKHAAGKKTVRKRAGTRRARKIVKKVEQQVKASKKEIARDAKRAAKKAAKPPEKPKAPAGVSPEVRQQVAKAAKAVADACATRLKEQAKRLSKNLKSECTRELNKVKRRAEESFKLAGFGESLGALSRKVPKRRKRRAAPAEPPRARKPPTKKAPPTRRPPSRPTTRRAPEVSTVSDEQLFAPIFRGSTRVMHKKRLLDVWVCAGPKRTGCGSTGHVVTGGRMFPAVRLRPGPKQVTAFPL
jgi:hypothetical protein